MRAFRSSSQTYHPTVPLFIVVLCFFNHVFQCLHLICFFVGVFVVVLMVVLREALCSTINASLECWWVFLSARTKTSNTSNETSSDIGIAGG